MGFVSRVWPASWRWMDDSDRLDESVEPNVRQRVFGIPSPELPELRRVS